MSYEPTVWQTGDTVTAEKLNKLENGVEAVSEASEDLAGKVVAMYKIGISANLPSTFIGNLYYFHYDEDTGELTDFVTHDFSGPLLPLYQYHSVSETDGDLYLMDPEYWKPQIKNAKLGFIPKFDVDIYNFGGDYEISSIEVDVDNTIPVVILTGTEFHIGVYAD